MLFKFKDLCTVYLTNPQLYNFNSFYDLIAELVFLNTVSGITQQSTRLILKESHYFKFEDKIEIDRIVQEFFKILCDVSIRFS